MTTVHLYRRGEIVTACCKLWPIDARLAGHVGTFDEDAATCDGTPPAFAQVSAPTAAEQSVIDAMGIFAIEKASEGRIAITPTAADFEVQWDETHRFSFYEDEDGYALTGYGHQDKAAFARSVNEYDVICGSSDEDDQYDESHVSHLWGVAFSEPGQAEDDWRFTWADITAEMPGAFPFTVISR